MNKVSIIDLYMYLINNKVSISGLDEGQQYIIIDNMMLAEVEALTIGLNFNGLNCSIDKLDTFRYRLTLP